VNDKQKMMLGGLVLLVLIVRAKKASGACGCTGGAVNSPTANQPVTPAQWWGYADQWSI
jgi:hypothetical protein